MVEYKATLILVPSLPARPAENFPGNYPGSEEAEQLEEQEEIERVRQIQEDTRELVFTPEKTKYPVGRASSNHNKGLLAARNNCLFLSPVMSRFHAEFQMVQKKKQIRIRDTDSMHGTYVNGKAIWGQEWQSFNTGDTLTFGAQVSRDGEIFMPKHFTCDLAWESLEPTSPLPSSDKPERRISGYGVSSEDLIVSDDDTESVEFDKGSSEYNCYTEEDEYSDDSEQEDSEYGKDSETIEIDDEIPASSTQTKEHKYGDHSKEEVTHDSTSKTVKLPGVTSLVPENPSTRSKFSIGSLMNHTQEALSSKSLSEKGDVEICHAEGAAELKLGEKSAPSKPTVDSESGCQQTDARLDEASPANKPTCPTLFHEAESESDIDDSPEELDTRGHVRWNSNTVAPNGGGNSTEKVSFNKTTVQESIKTLLYGSASTIPPTEAEKPSFSIQKKLSDLFDSGKPEQKKQDPTTTSGAATGRPKIVPSPQKDEFFAAMRENQVTLVNMLRDKWSKAPEPTIPFPQSFSANAADGGLHTSPLPWVRRCYASTNPSSTPQQFSAPMKNPYRQESSSTTQPVTQNVRKPHLFERLLESDEAKARTEKLENLKAAFYNHPRREVSFNPWSIEDDDGLEEAYLDDEDTEMALDEAAGNLFATRPPMETPLDVPYMMQLADKTKPRGFAISNLVDDQPTRTSAHKTLPVSCKWVTEKISKDAATDEDSTMLDDVAPVPSLTDKGESDKPCEIMPHVALPRGTKRTYEEASLYDDVTEDKIVQEADSVEEKIAEGPVDDPIVDEDMDMREVSEEKEMCEEVTPVVPVTLNPTAKVHETPKQAEPQQPPAKRARIFTTGFALGAVTGAVGLFAALVASAP